MQGNSSDGRDRAPSRFDPNVFPLNPYERKWSWYGIAIALAFPVFIYAAYAYKNGPSMDMVNAIVLFSAFSPFWFYAFYCARRLWIFEDYSISVSEQGLWRTCHPTKTYLSWNDIGNVRHRKAPILRADIYDRNHKLRLTLDYDLLDYHKLNKMVMGYVTKARASATLIYPHIYWRGRNLVPILIVILPLIELAAGYWVGDNHPYLGFALTVITFEAIYVLWVLFVIMRTTKEFPYDVWKLVVEQSRLIVYYPYSILEIAFADIEKIDKKSIDICVSMGNVTALKPVDATLVYVNSRNKPIKLYDMGVDNDDLYETLRRAKGEG